MSEDLGPGQVAERLAEGSTQLIDVREPYEHEAGRIAGDVHIELDRLAEEADRIDRGRPVVFYCRSGSRSALAAQAFAAGGFETYNLAGGIEAWVASGLPIEPEGGRVA
jgi:rhodanese-related sulfurtransferase